MTSFDALNNLTTDEEELIKKKIVKYFEEMDLDEQEIKKRIAFATDLEIVFRNLFLIMLGADMFDELESQAETFKQYAFKGYMDAMIKHDYSDDVEHQTLGYIEQYAKQRCNQLVDTAILHKADDYYLSPEHSVDIALDETNAVANYHREQVAIAQGYQYKTWITMRDSRVRHNHRLADGQTVGIFQPFIIGGYQAMFPMDRSLGLPEKEIIRCRCVLDYSGKK